MIVLCYGLPGMGKSTLLHDMIRAQPEQTFFIVDHELGWGPDSIHWRGNPPEHLTIYGPDDLPKLQELKPEEFAPGCYVFRNVEPLDVAALACAKGWVTFVDDEIDMIGQRAGWNDSPLRLMIHQGRHLINEAGEPSEVHIYGACRRPQNLHTDLTDLVSEVFCFRIHGDNTLGRMKRDAVFDADQWDTIRNLPKFHCWHWPSRKYLKISPIGGEPRPSNDNRELVPANDNRLTAANTDVERKENAERKPKRNP
jgi:hypothetical protein